MSLSAIDLNTFSSRLCAYGELKDQQFTNVPIIIGSEKEMTEPAEGREAMGRGIF